VKKESGNGGGRGKGGERTENRDGGERGRFKAGKRKYLLYYAKRQQHGKGSPSSERNSEGKRNHPKTATREDLPLLTKGSYNPPKGERSFWLAKGNRKKKKM